MELNFKDLSNEQIIALRDNGIISAELAESVLIEKMGNDLKKKYHYWQGKGTDQRFICKYFDPEGKRRDKRTKTEEEMIRFLIGLENGVVTIKKSISFKVAYFKWRKVKDFQIDANSIQKYDLEYKRHFEGSDFERKSINQIRKDDIIFFMVDKITHPKRNGVISDIPLCRRSAKQVWLTIRAVFTWAFENELIKSNPCGYIRPAKEFLQLTREHVREEERVVISPDDLSRLNAVINETIAKAPEYMPAYAVRMIMLTGARVGEASTMKWKDIEEVKGKGKFLRICRHESQDKITGQMREKDIPKNGHDRLIPITAEIDELLQAVREASCEDSEWIFPAEEGGHITQSQISSCMRNKCKQANVLDRGCYTLRRTVNSRLRADGMDPAAAASMLGNTVAVNNRYYTFDVRDADDKRTRLSSVGQSMIS